MLDKRQIQELTKVSGFSLWQTEKDYLQHVFLLFLSIESKRELIFKGGTALQKVYGLNRFSLDLDFTSTNGKEEEIVNKIAKDIKDFGYETEVSKNVQYKEESKSLTLKIKGPLYDGTEKSITSLRIEISHRRDLQLEPETKEIVPIYPDIRPYIVLVMRLEEILAEKIRAIYKRGRARDLYDLWFLIRKNTKYDTKLINKKLEYYKLTYNKQELKKKIQEIEKIWVQELKPIATFTPQFQTILKDIEPLLNNQ
ncbi:MAG: nucleotidyl transferase AbiEii/AbiGii toxin family protein [Nitrososphaeria archaeon]